MQRRGGGQMTDFNQIRYFIFFSLFLHLHHLTSRNKEMQTSKQDRLHFWFPVVPAAAGDDVKR